MWRAWGIVLLVLSQDPAPAFDERDHEFRLRPPAGWLARPGMKPVVVRFLHPAGERKADAEIQVVHIITPNPTPLKSFEEQAKAHVAENFKGAVIHEEKRVTAAGRPAFRFSFTHEKTHFIKTAVHRTNLEYYLVDIVLPEGDAGKQRAAAEEAAASFQIVPSSLNGEETAAFGRTRDFLKTAKLDPSLLGERWYGLYLGPRKAGHQRMKLAESEGLLSFEMEVVLDLGDGNRDASTVRGAFSPDGRVQRVDSEQIKTNDKKERWQFRAAADLKDGKLRASRDMNGAKEEATLEVPEGVLLSDVAEFMRGRLAVAGKGNFLMKTLSPFADEPNIELVESGGMETLDVDGRKGPAAVVLCRVDRRKTVSYTYGSDGVLLRQGGGRDVFIVRALSKEEALKQP